MIFGSFQRIGLDSSTFPGTLDLVFIESQAAGIAVVGPRAVAVPLVVEEGVNGCLYTPLDMKDAKRAIKDLDYSSIEMDVLRCFKHFHHEVKPPFLDGEVKPPFLMQKFVRWEGQQLLFFLVFIFFKPLPPGCDPPAGQDEGGSSQKR